MQFFLFFFVLFYLFIYFFDILLSTYYRSTCANEFLHCFGIVQLLLGTLERAEKAGAVDEVNKIKTVS